MKSKQGIIQDFKKFQVTVCRVVGKGCIYVIYFGMINCEYVVEKINSLNQFGIF